MKNPIEERREKSLKLTRSVSASDEVHRIIPLGLTLGEARAWYVNHVLIPRFRWSMVALFAGFVILLALLTEVGQLLEQNLTTHMVLHDSLFIVTGFLFAYAANPLMDLVSHLSGWSKRRYAILYAGWVGEKALSVMIFGVAASLIAYWYLPAHFDSASLNISSAIGMHLTLLFAGMLVFVGGRFLTRRLKLLALVVAGKLLGLYGMFLLLIPRSIYAIYPSYEQVYAGAALLFVMLILDFTIMPFWLYDYFGGKHIQVKDRIHQL